MDCDITTARRVLTTWRNRERDFVTKQRLTNMLNTLDEWRRESEPKRKAALLDGFKRQWAEFEEHVAA